MQSNVGILQQDVSILQQQMKQAFEGTAIAIAMGGASLPADKRFAISTNWGNFRGQNAVGVAAQFRLTDYAVANLGVGGGFAQGGIGSRAGRDVCLVMAGIRRYLRAILLIAFTCAVCIGGHAQTPKQKAAPVETPTPKPAQIDRNGVLILIRSALLALDQANKTGNYTALRDLGAPGFQINTAARLGEIFAKQRADNLDLSGVAVIDPQLSLLPQIEPNGMMRMAGFFPSVPSQVNFELAFAPVNGQWRLFGISVSIGQSAPAAPEPPPPTQKQPVADTTKQPAPNGEKHPQQTTPKPAAADETK